MSELSTERRWRAAEITVSDSRRGVDSDDRSGDVIVARFALLPADVVARESVPDDIESIRASVRQCVLGADILILSGGTGLGPRDVTPQALVPMFDYEVPGMAEVMRQEGLKSTPHAMLSRQVVGVTQQCLVLSLPGKSGRRRRVPRRGLAGAPPCAGADSRRHASSGTTRSGEVIAGRPRVQ